MVLVMMGTVMMDGWVDNDAFASSLVLLESSPRSCTSGLALYWKQNRTQDFYAATCVVLGFAVGVTH